MNAISKWFIDNPIAAKIIMLVILFGGFLSFPLLPKVFFPEAEINYIRISMSYPGAGPEEIETQICRRIEQAIKQLDDIEEITSTSREGSGEVLIEVTEGGDIQRLINDVKAEVESINTFPTESEKPLIVEQRWEREEMNLMLYADISERDLKELGEQIREEIAALPYVSNVKLLSPRNYEVGIEVSESTLREYGLNFSDVANAIRSYSVNQPGGKITDREGDIALQTRSQAESELDFEQIPLIKKINGSVLTVGDIANVVDGFEETDYYSALNGKQALQIQVLGGGAKNILRTSDNVEAYLEKKVPSLPDNVGLMVWNDRSVHYRLRLETLIKNGSSGLILVFIMLVLFLRPSLAFWVSCGIAIAFLGALWSLSLTPVTLNVLSMFSFIMILGIVVDDAIIVGESVHTQQTRLGNRRLGAIEGTQRVLTPVFFAVISTIIFFAPFFFFDSDIDTKTIAIPVCLALLFSLFESLFLLPSHLAGEPSKRFDKLKNTFWQLLTPLHFVIQKVSDTREKVADSLPAFANGTYRRFLLRTLSAKRITIIVFAAFFSFSFAAVKGGWLPFYFFPRISVNIINAKATMPESVAYSQVINVMNQLEEAAANIKEDINNEYKYELVEDIYSLGYGNSAKVFIKIDDSNERPISAREVANRWRKEIGAVQNVNDLNIGFTLGDMKKPLEYVLRSNSQQQLDNFTHDLVAELKQIEGLFDVLSSLESPSKEVTLAFKEEAFPLSIDLQDISQQVRRAFYGEEVQRIPRQREDVRVMVRYPKEERSYSTTLKEMYISDVQNPELKIPLSNVADIEYRDSLKRIDRLDAMRVNRVSADVEKGFQINLLSQTIQTDILSKLQRVYPDVIVSLKGEHRDSSEFMDQVKMMLTIVMLVIYGLMAVMFRSYWQPFLVLIAIPFGFMGAVFGHLVVGKALSMFSILGMIACAGVVVNDNVVLIDRINTLRLQKYSVRRAVVEAAIQRFRAIVLTSLTTFIGLAPILMEKSVQAQFLIPMVTSLAFGVVCATFITLLFVPSLYLFFVNVQYKFRTKPALATVT